MFEGLKVGDWVYLSFFDDLTVIEKRKINDIQKNKIVLNYGGNHNQDFMRFDIQTGKVVYISDFLKHFLFSEIIQDELKILPINETTTKLIKDAEIKTKLIKKIKNLFNSNYEDEGKKLYSLPLNLIQQIADILKIEVK